MSDHDDPGPDEVEADGGAEPEWLDPLLSLRNLEHRSASELGIELDKPRGRRRPWLFVVLVVVGAVVVAAVLILREDGATQLTDLSSGSCYRPAVDHATDEVTKLSCDGPHAAELVAFYRDPSGANDPFPGKGELTVFTQSACVQRVLDLAGASVDQLVARGVLVKAAVPDETGWNGGDRALACSVVDADGGDLTEPVLHR